MNCDEIVSGLILEFRRGTLIMVVLAQLSKPMYGYSLVKELEGKGISIEGNTLYPLLRRLESQGRFNGTGKMEFACDGLISGQSETPLKAALSRHG